MHVVRENDLNNESSLKIVLGWTGFEPEELEALRYAVNGIAVDEPNTDIEVVPEADLPAAVVEVSPIETVQPAETQIAEAPPEPLTERPNQTAESVEVLELPIAPPILPLFAEAPSEEEPKEDSKKSGRAKKAKSAPAEKGEQLTLF